MDLDARNGSGDEQVVLVLIEMRVCVEENLCLEENLKKENGRVLYMAVFSTDTALRFT